MPASQKTIGLIGGMSWESSIEYERIINEAVRNALGGTHSADLLLRSYDFAVIEALQEQNRWDEAAELLASDAAALAAAGADCIVICTNTMHLLADRVQEAIDVPLIHLADTTAAAVVATGVSTVALLGTRYTMEADFYRGRLEQHGLEVLIPEEPDRTRVHDVIYRELVRGVVTADSKRWYLEIINRLIDRGAAGVIAGCTEIELLVAADDVSVPYFPTARLHAEAAAAWALGDGPAV